MIEILILYIINNRDKTIYAIRKEIIELFGTFTKPSLGTIHPALKRLLEKKCVQLTERMSEGGKKSSYYSTTEIGKKYFKELFFSDISENPSLFYNQLQARFGTMSLLNKEEKLNFLNEINTKLDLYKYELENKLNDEFINLDFFQKALLQSTKSEIKIIKEYIQTLKVSDECNS